MNRQPAETCNLCGHCNPQWVFEADGSVYPCDFYALDQWKLGNILTDSFEEMKQGRKWQAFIAWSEQIPEECQACPWFALCRNGCRRNREPVTASSARKNLYCSAYWNFLEYAYPRLTELYWMRQLDPGRFQ